MKKQNTRRASSSSRPSTTFCTNTSLATHLVTDVAMAVTNGCLTTVARYTEYPPATTRARTHAWNEAWRATSSHEHPAWRSAAEEEMNVTSSSRSSGKRGPRLARRAPTPPSGSGSGFFGWLRALALRGLATGPETNSAFITSCFSLPRNRNAGCDTTSDQDPPACRSASVGTVARAEAAKRTAARVAGAVAAAAASATALRIPLFRP